MRSLPGDLSCSLVMAFSNIAVVIEQLLTWIWFEQYSFCNNSIHSVLLLKFAFFPYVGPVGLHFFASWNFLNSSVCITERMIHSFWFTGNQPINAFSFVSFTETIKTNRHNFKLVLQQFRLQVKVWTFVLPNFFLRCFSMWFWFLVKLLETLHFIIKSACNK